MPQYRLHDEGARRRGLRRRPRGDARAARGDRRRGAARGGARLLAAAGASVEGSRVRIPAALVDDALAAAPRSITLTSAGPGRRSSSPPAPSTTAPGPTASSSSAPAPETAAPARSPTSRRWRRCRRSSPNIDFVLSMVHPHELPAHAAPVAPVRGHAARDVQAAHHGARGRRATCEVFNEMAAACGAADSWAIYAMPTPPLTHGKESTDRLVGCARLGIPMIYASAFLPGATAPASVAGCVVLANAEMLSGLVISAARQPRRAVRLRRRAGLDGAAHRRTSCTAARRRWPRSRPRPTWRATTACRRSGTAAAPTRCCSTSSGRSRPA